jgi:LPXTG-site transpeptidase (sortase) family protein
VFSSGSSNLVNGDTNGAEDIFLREVKNGSTIRVSVDSNGTQGNSDSASPSVSSSGEFVAFFSNANNLAGGDANSAYDIFLHNTKNQQTTLVSAASNGTPGNGPSLSSQRPIAMSSDGQYIAYLSYASNLVEGDTNGVSDVFLFEPDSTQQTVELASRSLPDTGFTPNKETLLPRQPMSKLYTEEDIWLVIPPLEVRQLIVGVPRNNGQWDISWLGNGIGWLHGTAFPTWSGNSVLTGHAYNSNGEPGSFVDLGSLTWDDNVIIESWGQQYIYKVRSVSRWTSPQDGSILTKHEELPWLTLITCRSYDEKINTYRYRIVVRAVLIEIK